MSESQTKNIGSVVLGIGVILSFLGLVVGTTAILQQLFDASVETSQWWSGVLGGVGFSTIFFGFIATIPNKSLYEFKLSVVGIIVSYVGVSIYALQFPENWDMYQVSTIFLTTFVYTIGIAILFITAFHVLVNFKLKNSQNLTVTHRVEEDSSETDEDDSDETGGGASGIGRIGSHMPDMRRQNGD